MVSKPDGCSILGRRLDGVLQLTGGDSPRLDAGRSCGVCSEYEEEEESCWRGLWMGWLGAAATAASRMRDPTIDLARKVTSESGTTRGETALSLAFASCIRRPVAETRFHSDASKCSRSWR